MSNATQHKKDIRSAGVDVQKGKKLLVMVHGRGGTAEDILGLAEHLQADGFALLAPQATGNTWYPYSFMAPVSANEPWLTSAIDLLQAVVQDAIKSGIEEKDIYFLGFSQGACLALEFAARHAKRYGGVIAFTGGLIGKDVDRAAYSGDFEGTPVFIGSSNPDPHVPVTRIEETENVLKEMGAAVVVKIYNGMGHTINADEIEHAKGILNK